MDKSVQDELKNNGIYIDDVHRLRIFEPNSAQQTQKFKEECDQFIHSSRRFETVVESFRLEAATMATLVEQEKQRAVGLRLYLDLLVKKKEEDQRRLMVAVDERSTDLERLRLELDLTEKAGLALQETIDQFQMLQ